MIKLITAFCLVFSSYFIMPVIAQSPATIIDSVLYGSEGIKSKYPNAGLSIGIINNGKTYYYNYGTRTINGNDRITKETLFEIGSATKTVTGLLLAIGIENKTFELTDYIDDYLPATVHLQPALRHKVRLTDLVSHQSGLPNLSNDTYLNELVKKDPANPFRFVDTVMLYDMLNKTDSLHNHGHYQYNNYAYALLGVILQRRFASTLSYRDIVQHHILNRLGMKYTGFEYKSANKAGLYDEDQRPQQPIILNAVDPAGGLKSNAVDLVKYLQAYLSEKSPMAKAMQLTEQTFYKDDKRKVGLGWYIKDNYYEKDGDTFGNSCLLRFDVEHNIGIVVLSNRQDADIVNMVVQRIYTGLLQQRHH